LLGGVQAFGISGLFIGPVTFALAQALFSLIREETHLRTDDAVEEPAHTVTDVPPN
jgi:predicted PurR-regulated permease PerM